MRRVDKSVTQAGDFNGSGAFCARARRGRRRLRPATENKKELTGVSPLFHSYSGCPDEQTEARRKISV